ncbi:MAG: hypothetical protein R3B09_00465 [Nannocystaceae bacterium]
MSRAPIRASLPRALAVALLVAGCGDLFNYTASATEGGSTGESESESDASTGAAQMCGDPPAGPTCTPPSSSNLGALCGARGTESECVAFGDGVTSKCAWAQVTSYAGASACGGSSRGVCVGLQANGGGCGPASCGGGSSATTYYRFTASCELEVFQGSYCGFQVVDWSACEWTDSPSAECSAPWPSSGPPACKCLC